LHEKIFRAIYVNSPVVSAVEHHFSIKQKA